MKNTKLTKAIIAITAIGTVVSIIRLVIAILDRKSMKTEEVLYCDENYDDTNFVIPPDMYDQAEEDEEDTDNE